MTEERRAGGWIARLLRRRRDHGRLDPARTDLVVVASSFDDTEACSAVLERGAATEPRFDAAAEAVLRHHLTVPADSVATIVAIAAQDGYHPARESAGGALLLQRVQLLDALHCAQERSRMVGLAQRHDGTCTGWDALQPMSDSHRAGLSE